MLKLSKQLFLCLILVTLSLAQITPAGFQYAGPQVNNLQFTVNPWPVNKGLSSTFILQGTMATQALNLVSRWSDVQTASGSTLLEQSWGIGTMLMTTGTPFKLSWDYIIPKTVPAGNYVLVFKGMDPSGVIVAMTMPINLN